MKDYGNIWDQMDSLLHSYEETALVEDVEADSVDVKMGMLTPDSVDAGVKLYHRIRIPSLMADMAGNQSRSERLTFVFGGAVGAISTEISQEWLIKQAMNLMNNLQNVLAHNATRAGYWWGGCLGTNPGEEPDRMGDIGINVGTDRGKAWFELYWTCEVKIEREAIDV